MKPLNKNDERGDFITFKRNEFNVKREPNTKPIVEDSAGNAFGGMVGNGSLVDVRYRVYEWNNDFGKGLGADLVKLRIRELVPFEGAGDTEDEDFEPIEGGFVAGQSAGLPSDDAPKSSSEPEKVA